MKKIIVWFCFFLFAAVAFAEPAEPNPAVLSSDWWSYYEPPESVSSKELSKRVADTKQRFNASLDTMDAKYKVAHASLVTQINNQLDKFVKLKTADSLLGKPLKLPLDTFSLQEALERFNTRSKLTQDYEVSKEDIGWRKAVITEQRKQQANRRNQYLEMGKKIRSDL